MEAVELIAIERAWGKVSHRCELPEAAQGGSAAGGARAQGPEPTASRRTERLSGSTGRLGLVRYCRRESGAPGASERKGASRPRTMKGAQ